MDRFIKTHEGLVRRWVRYYSLYCQGRADVDRDDLFQAGCIGLIEAVKTFDGSKGTWSTWASFYIRKYIREALGRGKRLQTVPLDAPAYKDDDDQTSLLETLPDMSIIPDDDRLVTLEIVHAIRAAVDALPEDAAQAVRSLALQRLSRADAAREAGVTEDEIRRRYARGKRRLQHDERMRKLADLDQHTCFHAHKGVKAFHSSGSSIVEDWVEWRLGHAEKL